MDAYQFDIVPDGADYHRCFYRGEDLTSVFESGEFSASVANGSFRGIFPGDYITRKVTIPDHSGAPAGKYNVRFIIADLDFAISRRYAAHHAVIVPEDPVFNADIGCYTRSGGYADSSMNRTVLPAFAQGLSKAFGTSHLLRFNADGQSCLCRLMTQHMVFGGTLPSSLSSCFHPYSDYSEVDKCMGEEQLAIFRNNPDLRWVKDMGYWLSDVYDSSHYAYVFSAGCVGVTGDGAGGVRPFALLV